MMGSRRQVRHGRRLAACLVLLATPAAAEEASRAEPDAIVVGAGISGLAAALEAAAGGATVLVIDMWSVFGGHAVMSEGGVSMVDTPLQRARGIADSPKLAYRDFTRWGSDARPSWVRTYSHRSRADIYDWLTALGVVFDDVIKPPGNSVPRFHEARGRGFGIVGPMFRALVARPGVRFEWNTRVDELIFKGRRVVGVRGTNLRSGERREVRAPIVILATGGFQSNLEMVRAHWPSHAPPPKRLLVGSGRNAMGLGHALIVGAGGRLERMDHQWNYATGLPDPGDPAGPKGLNARNRAAIWVDAAGERFVNESDAAQVVLDAVLRRRPPTYWEIFDESQRDRFWVSGTDWSRSDAVKRRILDNPALTKTAKSWPELAVSAGLPPAALERTVRRYNEMVERGVDLDFARFGPGIVSPRPYTPEKLLVPPFYAVQHFPVTRKSMGGAVVDRSCRVLGRKGGRIPGLYAVGELTGFGGVNGKASLEGTFLGASILTGRIGARAALAELPRRRGPGAGAGAVSEKQAPPPGLPSTPCSKCHDIERLVAAPRPGYAHFEAAHRVVVQRRYDCKQCHGKMDPYHAPSHRIDHDELTKGCPRCHGVEPN